MLRVDRNARRIARDRLQRFGDLADKLHACHRKQFGHLLKAELIAAIGHHRGHRDARDLLALGHHRAFDPQLLEQCGFDVDAAGAVGIGNRIGVQQRLFEVFDAVDLRLGGTAAHHHADPGIGQFHPRCRGHQACVDQLLQRAADHDHHIGMLTACEPVGNGLWRFAHRRAKQRGDLHPGLPGVLRRQAFDGGREPTGGHHGQLLRACRYRQQRRRNDRSQHFFPQGPHHFCASAAASRPVAVAGLPWRRYKNNVAASAHTEAKISQ